jgi:hypothetical protein
MNYANVVERAAWTGAQALLAVLVVELGSVSLWWAAPLALTLSAAKTWVTERLTKAGA